jgi:hypothetical protein
MGHMATQVLPLQQPPLQALSPKPPHDVPHLKLLHACPIGQSVAPVHPQVFTNMRQLLPYGELEQPPPVVQPQLLLLQAVPLGLFVQSTHVAPEAPHVVVVPLPWHVPALQQ